MHGALSNHSVVRLAQSATSAFTFTALLRLPALYNLKEKSV